MPLFQCTLIHRRLLKRGPDGTWANGVHADSPLEELVGKTSNHGNLSAFGHGVVDEGRWTRVCDLRGRYDDATTVGDVGDGGAGEEEGAEDVGVHGAFELLRGDVFDTFGVVHDSASERQRAFGATSLATSHTHEALFTSTSILSPIFARKVSTIN